MKNLQKRLTFLLFATIILSSQTLLANNNLIILIDQNNQEHPNGNSEEDRTDEGAITMCLGKAIKEEAAPILATGTLLYNHVARVFRYEFSGNFPSGKDIRNNFNFFYDKWQLYAFPNTNYVLMFPRRLLSASDQRHNKAPGFNLSQLEDWTGLLPMQLTGADKLPTNVTGKKNSTLYELVRTLKQKRDKHRASFTAINKQSLFSSKSSSTTPVEKWSIYISGHGMRGTTAAGLALEEIQDFLIFLRDEVSTAFVCIDSCFVGGSNKYTFQSDRYDFSLMLAGRGNYTTYSDEATINFKDFFAHNSAITLEGASVAAEDFIEAAAAMADHSSAKNICAHPVQTNIHQVLVPGATTFSLIKPKNPQLIHTLSPTRPNAIRNASTIQLQGRATIINEDIFIAPSTATALGDKPGNLHRAKSSLWARLPVISDLMEKFALDDEDDKIGNFLGMRNRQKTHPTLSNLFDNLPQPINPQDIPDVAVLQLCTEEYLYPSITSDKHSPLQIRQRASRSPSGSRARRGSLCIDVDDDDVLDGQSMNTSSSAGSLDSTIVASSSCESFDDFGVAHEAPQRTVTPRPANLPHESHFFRRISIEAAPSPDEDPHPFLGGVLNFIRDSSCDILSKSGQSLTLVEELVGSDDIRPILEASRCLGLTTNNKKTAIERALQHLESQQERQQPLVLEHVYLYTNNVITNPDSFEIKLFFLLGGKAWKMDFVGNPRHNAVAGNPIAWHFDQISVNEHACMYNKAKQDLETHLPSPTK